MDWMTRFSNNSICKCKHNFVKTLEETDNRKGLELQWGGHSY